MFIKDYAVGVKYEKISIIFDLADRVGDLTNLSSINKVTGKSSTLPIDQIIPNANKLGLSKDPNSYLRFTLTFPSTFDIKKETSLQKAVGVNDILHETQHVRIDHQTLLTYKAIAYSFDQHTWMKDPNKIWYKERAEVFKQNKQFWYSNYQKQKNDGLVKDEKKYIDNHINDFQK